MKSGHDDPALDFSVERRSAGNINAIRRLIERVRATANDPDVICLCYAALAMRGEIEVSRNREAARLSKARDAEFEAWARETGLATDWPRESEQPALFGEESTA